MVLNKLSPWKQACIARGLYLLVATAYKEFDLEEMGELTRLASQFEIGGRS